MVSLPREAFMRTDEINELDVREYSQIVRRCSVPLITVGRSASDIHRSSQGRMRTARNAKGSA